MEDWEQPAWKCSSSLEISVTDVNDNPPRFLQETFTAFVAEDAPINGVITKMIATDADLGKYFFDVAMERHLRLERGV